MLKKFWANFVVDVQTYNTDVVRYFCSRISSILEARLPRHINNKHYPQELLGDIRDPYKHWNGKDIAQHEI